MPSHQARGRGRSLLRARGVVRTHEDHEEGDGETHKESVIGGGTNASIGNVGVASPAAFGGAKFM